MLTVTSMGGTFDVFNGHCDRQNGFHTNFARQRNVCDGVAWCEQSYKPFPCTMEVSFPLDHSQ